jgi:hypothetical protein
MIFLIESSATPIYHRIAVAFCMALRELGHTVHFYDPKEFDDGTFTEVINAINVDYYLSTNVFNKIHKYNELTNRFNFEDISHQMIFIHHDSAFCPPNSILHINKKLNALIYHQDRINHFFIENNNINQFEALGIRNCYPLNHASEFEAGTPTRDFKHQISFVGHLMSGLHEYPISRDELGHHLIGLAWNRYSKSSYKIQPEIDELCEDPYILQKISSPICNKLSIHRYLMQLVTQFSMAYRGEVISNIKNHTVGIYGGDLSYGTINDPLMRIDRSNIVYYPATGNYADTASIYANSKISLNLSSLQFDSAINNRIIDVILSGGFILTDRRSNLFKASEFSNEISFNTPEEMQHLLDFYLHADNKKKYDEIKMQVFNEFKEKYSYKNVCLEIASNLKIK